MNDNELKIYAVTHKEVDFVAPERILIGVGKNKDMKGVSVYDSTGENIAEKNYCFCELTALYWIWKNETAPYVGFEHYRRWFLDKRANASYLEPKKIKKILGEYDAILPVPSKSKDTVYEFYREAHIQEDMDIAVAVVKELYPDYEDALNEVLNSHECIMANMFIMRKELVDAYAKWIFDVLFEVERRVGDVSDRDGYQIRVFGFLSERLFYVWIKKNGLKAYHTLITSFDDRWFWARVKRKLKKIFKRGR